MYEQTQAEHPEQERAKISRDCLTSAERGQAVGHHHNDADHDEKPGLNAAGAKGKQRVGLPLFDPGAGGGHEISVSLTWSSPPT